MVDRRSPAQAPTRDLLRYFDDLHVAKFGVKAVIQGGKDARLLAGLWKSHGEDLVKELIAAFFASSDPFIRSNGYTVGMFVSQAGKLIARRGPVKVVSIFADWWDECKALHGGSCLSRYTHGLKMQDTRAS